MHLGLSARAHLLAARGQMRALSGPDALKAIMDGDRTALRAAQAELRQAKRDIMSPSLSVLRSFPIVGRQVQSAQAMTLTVGHLLDTAVVATDELAPEARQGQSRVALVQAVYRNTVRLATTLRDSDLGPATDLLPPLASARAELSAQILRLQAPLDRANAALPGLEQLLIGPTHMLLVAANNSQMAAGSGLPLAVARLDIADGEMEVGTFRWSSDLLVPLGAVSLSPELDRLWGFATPQDAINRSMISPQFSLTAPLLADQYRAVTGLSADGIAMIDIVGLQKLVAIGGRPADPAALPADRVIPELMHDQYVGADPTLTVASKDRQARLALVTKSIVADLLDPNLNIAGASRALMEAIGGRHVMMWSSHPSQQAAFVALGAAGSLSPDSVFVSLQNESSNKLDWFMRTKSAVTVGADSAGGRVVTVAVTIWSEVPDGQPRYVTGSALRTVEYGDYVGYLTLHVPGNAAGLRIEDSSPVIVSGHDGPSQVIGRLVLVPRNTTTTVTFTFTLPSTNGVMRVEPSARYPSITWTDGSATWMDDKAHLVPLA